MYSDKFEHSLALPFFGIGMKTDLMDVSLSELQEWVMDRQGGLACCDSWGRKESDTTERLN